MDRRYKNMMTMDMSRLLDSMENSIKLQGRARAEKRSRQAEREQKEFKEKLMRQPSAGWSWRAWCKR